jgi:hypothetical protein
MSFQNDIQEKKDIILLKTLKSIEFEKINALN